LEAQGRRPHWRFRLEHAAIEWQDLVRGPVHFEGRDLSDPVLIREDGSPLYHVCSVVDDIALGITHVVRGEDHVANTAAHVQLFEALGAEPPAFAHLALITDAAGQGLSKRLGSLSLAALREEEGLEPMAVVSVLARVGTSDPVEPFGDPAPLIAGFDFAKFARGSPKLDPEDLGRINAAVLHQMPFSAVKDRLKAMGLEEVGPDFWDAVRPNLTRFREVADWWRIVAGPVAPAVEDPDFCREAAALLPPEPWDAATWDRWVAQLKEKTGRKGKALFMPLRGALTGMQHGPELRALLPLIGRQEAEARLSGGEARH
jgi:glutamyl-tRNA synthetase